MRGSKEKNTVGAGVNGVKVDDFGRRSTCRICQSLGERIFVSQVQLWRPIAFMNNAAGHFLLTRLTMIPPREWQRNMMGLSFAPSS